MTGDLIRQDNTFIGAGAPVTGDEITGNDAAYPLNTFYIDKTNGASYVRTGVGKVTGDWTQIGGGGIESVVAGSGIDVDDTDPANPVVSATGGGSYLVYTALLVFPANSITTNEIEDTLSFAAWTRVDEGYYTSQSTTPYDATKIWLSGSSSFQSGIVTIPITDYATIIGYLICSVDSNGGNIRLNLESMDETFTSVDFEDLIGGASPRFAYPELKVLP